MPISITCPDCKTPYQLPDAMRGQTFQCDQCRASVTVGAAEQNLQAAPARGPLRPEDDLPPPRLPPRSLSLGRSSSGPSLVVVLLVICAAGGTLFLACLGLGAYWLMAPIAPRAPAPPPPLAVAPSAPASEAKGPAPELPVQPPKEPPGPRKGVVTWANYQEMLFRLSEARAREILGPPTRTVLNAAMPDLHQDFWEENGQFIRLDFVKGRIGGKHSSLQQGPNDKPFEFLTRARYDRIVAGMTMDDLEDVLGQWKNGHGNARTKVMTYEWIDPVTNRTVTVGTQDAVVTAKRSSVPEWGGFGAPPP